VARRGAKFSPNDIRRTREEFYSGPQQTHAGLAARYGVTLATIGNIVSRKTFSDID
jgi:hypothetical protein